jgi:hypothetical protein
MSAILAELRARKQQRAAKDAGRKASQKQERGLAELVGGKVTKGSGNGATKGDVRDAKPADRLILAECKSRLALPKSWTDVFAKTQREAAEAGVLAVVEVESRDGSIVEPWVAVPRSTFAALLAAYRREQRDGD